MPPDVLHQKTKKVLVITTLYKLGLVGKRAKTKEKTEWKKNVSQNFNCFLPILLRQAMLFPPFCVIKPLGWASIESVSTVPV